MDLTERIDADIKEAMRAREKDKLNALRAIKSALLLERTKEKGADLDKDVGLKILQKLQKQRKESASIYKEQGREDLAAEEEKQAEVIAEYLPASMSEKELEEVVTRIMEALGASSMKDMGRVMGEAGKQLAGKADGSAIAAVVKRKLAG